MATNLQAKKKKKKPKIFFLLWSAFCLGCGILCGLGIFVALYQTECQALLLQAAASHSDQSSPDISRRQLDECQFHTQALQAQTTSARNQLTKETASLRQELESSQMRITHLEQALAQQASCEDNAKSKQLQQQIVQIQQSLAQTEQSAHIQVQQAQQSLHNLQQTLQARFLQQTKLKYGSDNILVELTLDLGAQELQTIIVQMDRLDVMPMTTATFFYLLQAGLYTGTNLYAQEYPALDDHASADAAKSILLVHGGVVSADRAPTSRWADHGYNRASPLLWAQEAGVRQAPCPRYGFGLDWQANQGGDFFIHLGLFNSSRPCLGHVVEGMGLLHAQTRGTLAHARIVRTSQQPAGDEL